jgi:hypothetical protein
MKNLMMFIGNDLIESVPLNSADIRVPGYLGNFKRKLKIKYSLLLQEYPDPPEFLVVDPDPQTPSPNTSPGKNTH